MVNLIKIIERAKKLQNIKTDKKYAEIIGLSTPDFSKRKKTGTLLPLIIDWGISNKVNLHWLLTGEGEMTKNPENKGRVAEDAPYKEEKPDTDEPGHDDHVLKDSLIQTQNELISQLRLTNQLKDQNNDLKQRLNSMESRLSEMEKLADRIRKEDEEALREELLKKKSPVVVSLIIYIW